MSPRPPKPLFYLDENVPAYVGAFLKSLGHSVAFPPVSQRGKIDVLQLMYATKIGAILLTRDKDFFNKRFPPLRIQESPGVVVFRTSDPTEKQYQRLVRKLLRYLGKNRISGRLCIASVKGIKVIRVQE